MGIQIEGELMGGRALVASRFQVEAHRLSETTNAGGAVAGEMVVEVAINIDASFHEALDPFSPFLQASFAVDLDSIKDLNVLAPAEPPDHSEISRDPIQSGHVVQILQHQRHVVLR